MKTKKDQKSAFTLVEMLVVIVIISLVAMATTSAIRGAQRTARAAKCQANMKNLHTAVVAYLADRRELWGLEKDFERLTSSEYHSGFVYPRASSYECKEKRWEGGQAVDKFWECHGWVSWIKPSGKRLDANDKTPWINDDHKKSHAEDYYYPASTDAKMPHAIEEGYLFKYVGKDHSTYRCPEHRRAESGETVYLAYAMNNWFGSHVRPNGSARSTSSFSGKLTDEEGNEITDNGKSIYPQPSRMVLFIEMEDADPSNTDASGRKGVSAENRDKKTLTAYDGDSSWDWGGKAKEKARFSHRKGGQGNLCNVVFVDGHVAAIPEFVEDGNDPVEWNGHKNIEEVYKSMGGGFY